MNQVHRRVLSSGRLRNPARQPLLKTGILLLALASAVRADEPKLPAELQRLAGVWVFDRFDIGAAGGDNNLLRVWTSTVTITGDAFVLTKPMEFSKDMTGKIVLNPAAGPHAVDLKLDEYDFAAGGAPVQIKIPASTLPGLYRLNGDCLEITLAKDPALKRPADFDARGDKTYRMKLMKAPGGFKGFPKQVTLRVAGADGTPAAGVIVSEYMYRRSARSDNKEKPEWKDANAKKTDANGKLVFEYDEPPSVVRDAQRKQMAFVSRSPAAWLQGEVAVALKPECRLTGSITCAELSKSGVPIGWTNVYLYHDGGSVASCDSFDGKFEFLVPPGEYWLDAYGQNLLEGKPAPELAGVVGWKGTPVKLADLRGKYVLLEFTGHWCGPCMQSMPEMFELHERFKDKGLVIIGVHVDIDGEVDTAAKLDEKLAPHRKNIWKGKDIPFPVALVSGKEVADGEQRSRGLAAQQYGVTGYPTTVLIDREGKVVGPLEARGAKDAAEKIQKLLDKK